VDDCSHEDLSSQLFHTLKGVRSSLWFLALIFLP